jgi:tRNA (guanine37-N1)-methyltransferase
MRIDVLTIFPAYLAPLELSLVGRARSAELLDIHVHDLRDWTHDRHRTVDDTPYGGGPGMVMRPQPWGEALDAVLREGSGDGRPEPTLIVPTPAGQVFSQQAATQLAARPWLVFACGRYEGIDQRVVEYFAERHEVHELSVGDYVLNGGEAAALVMIEAVARLVPGVVGNPLSLVEESHVAGPASGLLEYPVYTKPPSWRGLEVPAVLLSGHHDRIEAWRHAEALRRTSQRRPDLAHRSEAVTLENIDQDAEVRLAVPSDAGELLTLQRCCWLEEARVNATFDIPALQETLADVRSGIGEWQTLVVRSGARLIASVRGRLSAEREWEIGRLMVVPDLAGRGLGRWLLSRIERAAPPEATSYRLFTGEHSDRNLRMYRRAGYRSAPDVVDQPGVVTLVKPLVRPDRPPGS